MFVTRGVAMPREVEPPGSEEVAFHGQGVEEPGVGESLG